MPGERGARSRNLLRPPGAGARATVELFFDLVYVFAVTQLSHYLSKEPTWVTALRALLLFAMVWLAWAYTTWVTNWLDPDRVPVLVMLLALALVSLVLSAGLPFAFSGWAWRWAGRTRSCRSAAARSRWPGCGGPAAAQLPAHPGLVPGQRRAGGGRRPGGHPRPGTAVAGRGGRGPARRAGRLLDARARPVHHPGLLLLIASGAYSLVHGLYHLVK
jgi:Bacterial low temperature requirement A protein (LtrA)